MMVRVIPFVAAFLLDLLLGDPHGWPHVTILIGKLITSLEKILRALSPKTNRGEYIAGIALVVLTICISVGTSVLLIWLCSFVSIWLSIAVQTILCWQCLAIKSLKHESTSVYGALTGEGLRAGRRRVSMIVGRDTDTLDESGVIKATIETVAENTSDGVIAPMLFMALGGAPLGILYKAVNTMDSMVGYRNKKYLYFGRAAARLDDAFNFIPARISALLMIIAAFLTGLDSKEAFRIFKRDRYRHKSPNSAQTESVCAGALHIQLAGDAYYFGKLVSKPTIGDALRPAQREDIQRANRLMLCTAAVCFALCMIVLGGLALWN